MITPLRTWRLWLVLVALLALPVLTYWDTIFAHYGLRDDYAVLREVHEEPGKVTAFCASHARPIFGWLSEQSLRHLSTIHDLQWARLWAALCAGLAAGGTTWVLVRQLRWRLMTAALVGALVALLPGTQVLVGWAICWGHLVGLILGIAGFAAVERGLRAAGRGGMAAGVAGGWALVAMGALTYQSNVLFYVVFIAAALPLLRGEPVLARVRWLGMHLAVVCAGLAGAFVVAKGLFAAGVFAQSDRVAFEPQLVDKFLLFLGEPLGNALSFLVINDDAGRTAGWHLLMAAVVLVSVAVRASVSTFATPTLPKLMSAVLTLATKLNESEVPVASVIVTVVLPAPVTNSSVPAFAIFVKVRSPREPLPVTAARVAVASRVPASVVDEVTVMALPTTFDVRLSMPAAPAAPVTILPAIGSALIAPNKPAAIKVVVVSAAVAV